MTRQLVLRQCLPPIFYMKRTGTAPAPQTRISRIYRRAEIAAAALAIVFLLGTVAPPLAQAQILTVLHTFTGWSNGAHPVASLVMDRAGNLYGTTSGGGSSGAGTVFKLDASGNLSVLYSFTNSGGDAAVPLGSLVMDTAGNLYGTTSGGGSSGYGTVFKLDASGNETVLHSFSGGDGAYPVAGLVMDTAGNLYGTTYTGGSTFGGGYCGSSGCGTVFELDISGNETVLHSFSGGASPYAGLVMDTAGNLYGTTVQGGPVNAGTVFKLDTSGNLTVLHGFTTSGGDGNVPVAGLVMDTAGNLYGTTNHGGSSGYGTVFKLDASGKETVLHSFSGGDGAYPEAGLVMDRAGSLYGTTRWGGATFVGGFSGYGTVFKLDASGNETVLHSFSGGDGDGAYPQAGLVMDTAGNLYGTTAQGGTINYQAGTIFKLSLAKHLASLGPAQVWLGLKNSDDQGTQFDLRAELYKNGSLIASGTTLCVTDITRNSSLAKEVNVAFGVITDGDLASGDVLSLKFLTRIGTNPGGSRCAGPGGSHSNATGLRLYYDSNTRASHFDAEITPDPMQSFYLHSTGATFSFDAIQPTGTSAKTKDSPGINFAGGNPWSEIGTWSRTMP